MRATLNPTVGMQKGKLWGFEFEHVIVATLVFIFSNTILLTFRFPLYWSWILSIGILIGLRLSAVGKKIGYLSFLLAWMRLPHIYLGKAKRGLQDGHHGLRL
jgi:hypothetical protein